MKKISVSLSGHRTSVSLESEFIAVLHDCAARDDRSIGSIIGEIDAVRTPDTNLSSAVRIWILRRVMADIPATRQD